MGELEKEVEEARLSSSSTATENEERKVAAVKQEYEEQLAALNEQISIMQNALNEEEAKTTKLHEEMEVNVKVGLASGCEIAEPGEGGAHAAAGGIAEPRSERRQRTNARDAEGSLCRAHDAGDFTCHGGLFCNDCLHVFLLFC